MSDTPHISPIRSMTPTAEEMAEARQWVTEAFENAKVEAIPFSFTYGGRPSAELLKTWECTRESRKLDAKRTEYTLRFTDPKTGLEVRCLATAYGDFPAVEWVIYFENKGDKDTLIIANVRALDTTIRSDSQRKDVVIRHARGTQVGMGDFGPIDDVLPLGARLKIGSGYFSSSEEANAPAAHLAMGGKGMSSVNALPFFNIDLGAKGMIAAVGWSGSWSAEFLRDSQQSVSVNAGMETTHLLLYPGEHIRTPRMLVMFWQGDLFRGHNLWRRLILKHYSPRPNGKPFVGPLSDMSWGAVKAEDQIDKIKWWGDHNLPLDCFWIDAGWNGVPGQTDCFAAAANRVPNPEFYPNGMKEVSDAAHGRGLKFLLWTWPHRALPGVEVGAEHPEWLINDEALDHGDPAANQWMIETNSRSIDEYGLDVYRQDGHVVIPPDSGPDRQGINQIRYFEGFYSFWDELLKRHPHLLIDNCAGGGTKIDLETGMRSVSLWRSDYQNSNTNNFDPIGIQGMTYGLSFFVPLSGGCTVRTDAYNIRSGYSPAFCLMWHFFVTGTWTPVGKIDDKEFNLDFDRTRKLLSEYLTIREYFYGDYYPLTPYSLAPEAWMAWQFDCPEKGEGMVQAFRRDQNDETRRTFRMMGLDPNARYEITDLDAGTPRTLAGEELMREGLVVEISSRPGAAVIRYRKL
jgi:alpha-galactosidase